jgi:molecular chaperone GrpE
MERDPLTNQQAAAEEAAAGAASEPEPTDGVRAPADAVVDGASAPAAPEGAEASEAPEAPEAPDATAADASVEQARADADKPEEPEAAEPDYRDQYVRAMAELDNVRKRARRDVAAAEARGIAKLARELLPALDNFARALDAAEAQPENRDHHLTDGIRLVQAELLAALARVGIEPDSPQGEPFDPHRHEAVAQQPVEGTASGTIVEVYSQGYRYRDDVLRPAKVVVAA